MKVTIIFKGGAGSGHHGHQGRPGKQGGSTSSGGGGSGGDQGHVDNYAKQFSLSPASKQVLSSAADKFKLKEPAIKAYANILGKSHRNLSPSLNKLDEEYRTWVVSKGHVTDMASSVLNRFGSESNYPEKDLTQYGRIIFNDVNYEYRQ